MAYDRLEPIGGYRLDANAAYIVQTLVNIYRDREKHPDPYALDELLIRFGPEAEQQELQSTDLAARLAMFLGSVGTVPPDGG